MKNSNIVKPTGLKGNDKLNRMRELMGNKPINEGITRSVVELTKQGPDGSVYAIVRENQEYYIKVSEAKSNLVTEDFQYMGGLQNKKDKVYSSYAKAIKQLNLKFMSLNEAAGKSGSFNTFKSDVIINEHHGMNPNATLSASKAIGDNDEYVIDKKGDNLKYDNKEGSEADGFGDNVADSTCEKDIEKVKLSENETAIDSMITGEEVIEEKAPIKKGFSIARAIKEMDEVIDSIATEDDKVNDILESLGDTEKAIMMEALNKNVNEIDKKIHTDKKPAFTDKEQAEIDSVVRQIDTDEVKKNVNESDNTSLFFEPKYANMIKNFNDYFKEKAGETIGVDTDGLDDDDFVLALDAWLNQLPDNTSTLANEIRKEDNTKKAFINAVKMSNQKDGVKKKD